MVPQLALGGSARAAEPHIDRRALLTDEVFAHREIADADQVGVEDRAVFPSLFLAPVRFEHEHNAIVFPVKRPK